jgi:hypothetical protein
VPKQERDKVLARIDDLRVALMEAQSEDVRQIVREALRECEGRLRELEAQADAARLR